MSRQKFSFSDLETEKISRSTPEFYAAQVMAAADMSVHATSVGEDPFRLRLMADALVARGLLEGEELPRWASVSSSTDLLQDPTLRFGTTPYEIPYLAFSNCVVVGLLGGGSEDNFASGFVSSLSFLRNQYGASRDWIFDLGSVKTMPDYLLGFLVGFEQEIRRADKHVMLLWLEDSAVSSAVRPLLQSRFSLKKKGMYLVSKTSFAVRTL